MSDKKVAIVGVGQTVHDIHPRKGWRSLLFEAVYEALNDAHMTINDIQMGLLSMAMPEYHGQEHPACVANWEVGMCGAKGFIHVENACASGTSALKMAWMSILSGQTDVVLVVGVDKPSDSASPFEVSSLESDVEWEHNFGISWAPMAAFTKSLYMQKYGVTDDEFLASPVVTHEYAVKNPKCSQFGKTPLTIEEAKLTPTFWGQVHIAELCLVTDGACALVLTSAERAKDYTTKPVYIEHLASGSDPELLGNKWKWGGDEFLLGRGARETIKALYEATKMGPDDVDVAMVHDSVSVAMPILLEGLGIFKRGEGPRKILEGEARIGGRCPTNTMGGFKWMGHPPGVSGLNQIHELTIQLRGDGGERQAPNAEVGIFANEGGNAASFFTGILRR